MQIAEERKGEKVMAVFLLAAMGINAYFSS